MSFSATILLATGLLELTETPLNELMRLFCSQTMVEIVVYYITFINISQQPKITHRNHFITFFLKKYPFLNSFIPFTDETESNTFQDHQIPYMKLQHPVFLPGYQI